MKTNISLSLLVLFFSVLTFTSCNKTERYSSDDGFNSSYTKTTISGIVYDENHIQIQGAKVTAYGHVQYTNANGTFLFENLSVNKHKCYITVEYSNHFTIMRSRKPITNGITNLDAHLIAYNNGVNSQTDNFIAGTPYVVNLNDGSSIDFTNSTFVDENGQPYSGNITCQSAYLDATSEDYSRQSPGGDQIGIDNSEEQLLDTRTGILVELKGSNGQALNLADGTTADISAQIPASLIGSSPGSTPMYFASNSNGYSNREGSATENGAKYEQTVGHFTYWSTQIASPNYGIIHCRVIDASGQTLAGVRVQVGEAYNITDMHGSFEMKVPAGIAIPVAVRATDFYGLSVTSNQSAWSNGETRTVELQLPNNLDEVTGELIDCNHNSISGLLTLRWNGYTSSVYTTNGHFSLPTISGASTYELYINSSLRDTTLSIDVNTGINNVGEISLCQPDLPDIHNLVEINQGDTLLLDYTNFYAYYDGHLYVDSITQDPIRSYAEVQGSDGYFTLDLQGVTSAGTYDISSNSMYCTGLINASGNYFQIDQGTLTISQYGTVGNKIKGQIDGIDSYYGSPIRIEFEVIRSEDVTQVQ